MKLMAIYTRTSARIKIYSESNKSAIYNMLFGNGGTCELSGVGKILRRKIRLGKINFDQDTWGECHGKKCDTFSRRENIIILYYIL